jgi:nucleoside transporter
MNTRIRFELSVMMFLQFIWGAWAVTMGTYLFKIGFTGAEIGKAYSTTAWAAVLSPFFIGMIADRFFPAQIVLGVMHLLGSALMFWASTITVPGMFFWVLLGYALCYMPTLALVNAISFHQMADPSKEFPSIRVLGTLGWIVVGWIISLMKVEGSALPLQIAAGASLLMGLYSFVLPNTPPKSAGKKVSIKDILGLDALKLMKEPSFAIFVVSSLLICIPLAFYYSFCNAFLKDQGMPYPALNQSLGQVSEVLFMLVMPFFFLRLGVKKMLLIGMLAWAVRYVCFAYGAATMPLISLYYIGIILHGVCYDFFFVTGQLYVDKRAPAEIRANVQGFIALVTYGVGMIIGSNLSGVIVDRYLTPGAAGTVGVFNWQAIWLIPALMAAVVMVFLGLFFKENLHKYTLAELSEMKTPEFAYPTTGFLVGLTLGIPLSYFLQAGAVRMFVSLPQYVRFAVTDLPRRLGASPEPGQIAMLDFKSVAVTLLTTMVVAGVIGIVGGLFVIAKKRQAKNI